VFIYYYYARIWEQKRQKSPATEAHVQKKPAKIARFWSNYAYKRFRLKLLLVFFEFYDHFNKNLLTHHASSDKISPMSWKTVNFDQNTQTSTQKMPKASFVSDQGNRAINNFLTKGIHNMKNNYGVRHEFCNVKQPIVIDGLK